MAAEQKAGRRRRLPRAPVITYPRLAERAYLRDIVRHLEPARRLIEERVLPLLPELLREATGRADAERADDYAETLARIFDLISIEYGRAVSEDDLRKTAQTAATETNRHNRAQVGKQLKTVLGIDVLQSEPWLEPAAKAFVRENVKLIKTVPGKYFDEIERLVLEGTRTGRRHESIATEIKTRYGVSESRAARIARDQVGKFNGQLDRKRHEDLGLDRYRWRCAMDERVRGRPDGHYPKSRHNHFAREGQVFAYDKPPPDGHPGEPIQCRCWAEPIFEDLLGEEFADNLEPAPAASAALPSRPRGRW